MPVAIVVPQISPRLSYVLDWIFRLQAGEEYQVLTHVPEPGMFDCIISYGAVLAGASCTIPATGLLYEAGICPQDMHPGEWQGLPVLFTGPDTYDISFDIFSAVFYLLSRYEEYLPFDPDKHDRYPATESVLYRMGCLERPLVDEWLQAFFCILVPKGGPGRPGRYRYLPTYDIDIAWSYRHKGWWRNLGGYLRSAAGGDFDAIRDRTKVLRGTLPDPFDSFEFLEALHQGQPQRPYYFILAGLSNTPFDKQILPGQEVMAALIRQLAAANHIGTHPSYFTAGDIGKAREEKEVLERITGQAVTCSRQHYIKLRLPGSCRQLLALGIGSDYSMGYGTHLGFRAGTSQPFAWYDLEQEQETTLRITPFCFMDATAHYELKLSPEAAFARLHTIAGILQKVNGTLVTVFHNFSLGTDPEWSGWREQYTRWVREQADLL